MKRTEIWKLVRSIVIAAVELFFPDLKWRVLRVFANCSQSSFLLERTGQLALILIVIQAGFTSRLDAEAREVGASPQSDRALRPDGVIQGKIILRSGPKLVLPAKDLKLLVDEQEKVPVVTVHVGTSPIEFRRAESKPVDGLEVATIGEKGEKIYLHKEADVTSEHIAEARVVNDSNGKPAIEIRFTMAGSTKFAKVTTEHLGKRLAIVFNGKVISAPTIRSKISTKALITGNFTKEEADGIAKAIMNSKEDKKEKSDQSKSSESDLDNTSELKKDRSPIEN